MTKSIVALTSVLMSCTFAFAQNKPVGDAVKALHQIEEHRKELAQYTMFADKKKILDTMEVVRQIKPKTAAVREARIRAIGMGLSHDWLEVGLAAASVYIDIASREQDAVTQAAILRFISKEWRPFDYVGRDYAERDGASELLRVFRALAAIRPANEAIAKERIQILRNAQHSSSRNAALAANELLCTVALCSRESESTQRELIESIQNSWKGFGPKHYIADIRIMTALEPVNSELQEMRIKMLATTFTADIPFDIRNMAARAVVYIAETERDFETQQSLLKYAKPKWNQHEYVAGDLDYLVTLAEGIAKMISVNTEIHALKMTYLAEASGSQHPVVTRALNKVLLDMAGKATIGIPAVNRCEGLFRSLN